VHYLVVVQVLQAQQNLARVNADHALLE
jgi:hypothetical protein